MKKLLLFLMISGLAYGGTRTDSITVPSTVEKLTISTNVYINGYSSATEHYGGGANLTGILASTWTISYAVNAGTAAWATDSALLGGEVKSWFSSSTVRTDLNTEISARQTGDSNLGVSTGTNLTAIESNDTDIAALSISTAAIQSDLDTAEARIVSVGLDTGTIKAALDAEITATNSDFDSIGADTGTIQAALTAEINATNTDFDNVGADTGTIQSSLTAEIADTDTNFGNVATDTTTINTNLTATALSTGTNKTLIDTKQAELSTDTWKAHDSDLLDGYNYDAFVSTVGDTMSGTLDMGNNAIINIGAAGADFSGTGGLTLQDVLNINDQSIANISWQDSDRDLENQLFTNVSTSPTNVDDVSTKGYCDYAVKEATATYNTDLKKDTNTWTGYNAFGELECSSLTITGSDIVLKATAAYSQNSADSELLDGYNYDWFLDTTTADSTYQKDLSTTTWVAADSYKLNGTDAADYATDAEVLTATNTLLSLSSATANFITLSSAAVTYAYDNTVLKKDGSVGLTANWDAGAYDIYCDQIRADSGNGLQLYDDGGNGIFIKDGGNVGIGTTIPTSYDQNADDFVIYQNGHCGITIACEPSYKGGLIFADGIVVAGSKYRGCIQYDHSVDKMYLWTRSKYDSQDLTLDNGNVGIGTTSPETKFVVKDGSITISGTNANLVVAGNSYITGFSSANEHYGGGANLTGITAADYAIGVDTAANKTLIDTKQAELSTDTWKAHDSDLLDGYNYDWFLDTTTADSTYQKDLSTTTWVAADSYKLNGTVAADYATDTELSNSTNTLLSLSSATANFITLSSAAVTYLNEAGDDGSNLTGIKLDFYDYNIHIASPIVSNLCEGCIKTNYAITIDTVSAVMINNAVGNSSCVFHLYECDSNGANQSVVQVSSFSATGNQSQDQWFSFTDATLDAGDWLQWEIIEISTHSIPSLSINIKYHR